MLRFGAVSPKQTFCYWTVIEVSGVAAIGLEGALALARGRHGRIPFRNLFET